MAKKKPKLNFPDRKISETFLQFAEPLLDALGPNATEAHMAEPLKVAWTVWNAVVYADVANNRRPLDLVGSSVEGDDEVKELVESLIERKRTLFGDDDRLIGDYELFCKDGEYRLRAEARNPLSAQE